VSLQLATISRSFQLWRFFVEGLTAELEAGEFTGSDTKRVSSLEAAGRIRIVSSKNVKASTWPTFIRKPSGLSVTDGAAGAILAANSQERMRRTAPNICKTPISTMSVHVNLPSQACARRSCQISRTDRPRKRRPAGIRRNTGRLYGGAINCRRRFSTDTILSASGIVENASDVARKASFGAAGSFQGGRERHPFKIAPDRRPDSLELRPTSRWSAAFAAESRVEVRRPNTQGVAQTVRREVLAPKQQYGDLERRVTRLGRARSDPEHAFNGSSLSKP
jgi:hypothetical protein